ncbi:hypothetical protein SDC9_61098 [bioreactor metagenome]|uniref:Uncharacterized protein n=1 Tax=bioreactor metagenome TaxID=1076179 RepID=A0A644XKX6_9ZZZZ
MEDIVRRMEGDHAPAGQIVADEKKQTGDSLLKQGKLLASHGGREGIGYHAGAQYSIQNREGAVRERGVVAGRGHDTLVAYLTGCP